MTTPVVSVSDLRKTYRSGLIRRKKVQALQGVSFEVQPGEIFGLLGPNGAGKTTLIKILLGIVKRTDGSASVLGLPAGDRRGRMRVGYLPENHRIPRHLTGFTALDYYGQLSHMPRREIRRKQDELLEMVGLGKWGSAPVKSYSKGMLQRLGLAQAMLHDPEVLILDEPTDGVDPVGRADIRETLFKLKEQGRTVFLNSHLLQEIELVADRVAVLNHGRLRHVGLIQDLTRGAASDLTFELVADEATTLSALSDLGPKVVEKTETTTSVAVAPHSQEEIDKAVDRIRQAGISIASMSRNRQTLEQAFLELIAAEDPEASSEEETQSDTESAGNN
ncbi:MAG: ABC transporter ATP-binding protein [Planctomycetes bacterium]|nr:ABC transporter ATP-binding protein [Planctomycetota bacterium]